VQETIGARLVQAIAAQDASSIAACFTHDAHFRALTPPGVRERDGAEDAGALIAAWFADSTVLELVDSRTNEVGGRLVVTYRFEGVEEGETYVVQQTLCCTLSEGKIAEADLLCSGFLPPQLGTSTKREETR
jgi:hypothetical protein